MLKFLTLILSASPNMMHFVLTFSIIRAQDVRLVAIEEVRNYGNIIYIKTFLKMGGGKMHTPHSTPWIRPRL